MRSLRLDYCSWFHRNQAWKWNMRLVYKNPMNCIHWRVQQPLLLVRVREQAWRKKCVMRRSSLLMVVSATGEPWRFGASPVCFGAPARVVQRVYIMKRRKCNIPFIAQQEGGTKFPNLYKSTPFWGDFDAIDQLCDNRIQNIGVSKFTLFYSSREDGESKHDEITS